VPEPQSGGQIKDLKWKIIVTDPDIMNMACWDKKFKVCEPFRDIQNII